MYRFDLGVDEWLTLLSEEMSPLLDSDNTGVFALLYQCFDPTVFVPTQMTERGVSDRFSSLFREGNAHLPPQFVADGILRRSWYLGSELGGWRDIETVRNCVLPAIGVADLLALNAIEPDGAGCGFASFKRERRRLSLEARITLTRVARHLAAAHRLRRRFGNAGVSSREADAVLDPAGHVVHANGAAQNRDCQTILARAGLAMDRARSRQGRNSSLRAIRDWQAHVGRHWTLVDCFERDGRRYVLAIDNRQKRPGLELLSEREREVVHHALRGLSNKVIAFELGLAHSTVRVLLARAAIKLEARSRNDLLAIVRASVSPDDRV